LRQVGWVNFLDEVGGVTSNTIYVLHLRLKDVRLIYPLYDNSIVLVVLIIEDKTALNLIKTSTI
jgi:hypothetical protein